MMHVELPEDLTRDEASTPGRVPLTRRSTPYRPRLASLPDPEPDPTPLPTNARVAGQSTTPAPTPTPSSSFDIDNLITETGLSSVVKTELEELMLGVVAQVRHDLFNGNASTRSQIAKQFLPSLVKAMNKEEESEEDGVEALRAQMDQLHHQVLHSEPKLYPPASAQAPDSETLPYQNPETGEVEGLQDAG